MFEKILIANRGEIACRVIHTARKMGISTVAVYSDADASARHVRWADEAVHIGAAESAQSYLNIEKIIDAAKTSGAEAIHPGYGFLSENPAFVDAVEKAGLVFIGPKASSIRAMGLKDAAKVLMQEAGVPVVPGYHGESQDPQALAQEAQKIGYPVLIKARAGGGGKGMRHVDRAENFAEALAAAQREGQASFGDPHCLIEKFIANPRHIEVQIVGDALGNIVHLFERDCTLQRRHQKVIEEAPAPGISEAFRRAITQAAVRAASAVNYQSTGTVEFIVDGDALTPESFWFMEMNTRLQVEHPVTEAITGIDLVEWQLRVASGEALPCSQDQISINGHAIELRINAEDAARAFLPITGKINHCVTAKAMFEPAPMRADFAVETGDEISPYYDPMMGKLICHGVDRKAALKRAKHMLEQTQIAPMKCNLEFLQRLLAHQDFQKATMDTGLIARDYDALTDMADLPDGVLILAALCLNNLHQDKGEFAHFCNGPIALELFADLEFGSKRQEICLFYDGEYSWGGDRVELLSNTCARINGRHVDFAHTAIWGQQFLWLEGQRFDFKTWDHQIEPEQEHANQILAPMSGMLREVFVKEGDHVEKDAPICLFEAMKMEHILRAPRKGVLAFLDAQAGTQVSEGAILAQLEADDA